VLIFMVICEAWLSIIFIYLIISVVSVSKYYGDCILTMYLTNVDGCVL